MEIEKFDIQKASDSLTNMLAQLGTIATKKGINVTVNVVGSSILLFTLVKSLLFQHENISSIDLTLIIISTFLITSVLTHCFLKKRN